MRFEGFLALKYIKAQKRHTALTVISIIAALAMMTVLMTCFITMSSCMTARERDVRPYHIEIYEVTKEQADKLEKYDHVESMKLSGETTTELEDGTTVTVYTARLTLEKGIGGMDTYYNNLCKDAGIDDSYWGLEGGRQGIFNRTLLNYDMIDDEAYYNKVITYAGYSIYLIILALVLRLVIDTAFEVSSKERERQFGVLQSVGATPLQIRGIIIREGLLLGLIGVPVGIGLGLLLGYGLFQLVLNGGIIDAFFTSKEAAMKLLHYEINPLALLICAAVGFIWVYLSATGTGARVIRMTPIQAISNRSNTIKKVKKHSLFGLLFGWEGKMASRNARRQPKRFIVTVLSLTLSISMFGMFSILVDNLNTVIEESLVVADSLGNHKFDFDFVSMEKVNQPLGYQAGYNKLKNSALFTNAEIYFKYTAQTAGNSGSVFIVYVDEHAFNRIFTGDELPMTYDELVKSGGYLALNPLEGVIDQNATSYKVITGCFTAMTDEEWEALSEEEQEDDKYATTVGRSTESGGTWDLFEDDEGLSWDIVKIHGTTESTERELPVCKVATAKYGFVNGEASDIAVKLIAPISKFENEDKDWYGGQGKVVWLSANLAGDDDYQAAMQFIKANIIDFGSCNDMFGSMRKIRAIIGAFKMGGLFFIVMFGLIALINMINIVSTGILNRKSELASMQCVGMTDGQLYGMTIVECLQYALIACIASMILCALATWGTQTFLNNALGLETTDVEKMRGNVGIFVSYPRILIGSVCAFIAALAASILPLRRMQQETLVDRIRKVE